MEDNPLISVVIPTFNRENTISYCLGSVLAQTYKNLEIIVIDDCSTDNTVSIVKRISDVRIRCITLDNHVGAQGARNRGIHEARSGWIAFQDSDDEWLPEKVEKQVSVLAKVDYDCWSFIYCNGYRFERSTGIWSIRLLPSVEGRNRYSTLLEAPAPLFPTMMASKKALEKIGYLDENVPSFQEWDTAIRLSRYCRMFHVKEPLFVYHVGNRDTISGSGVKHVEGWQYIIKKYESDIKRLCGSDAWRRLNLQLLRRCLNFGLIEYYDGYRWMAGGSKKFRLQMCYLMICRKCGIRPSNVMNHLLHKVLGGGGHFAEGQIGAIKHLGCAPSLCKLRLEKQKGKLRSWFSGIFK